ncbi:MAG: hypothetical protein NC548_44295 [Lachnospiraceae bacterium]|nr:hypothetical protein [Lachnospiraceae bacterium]
MDWKAIIIEVIAAILAALGSWVLVKVKTLINTKIKNAKIREILDGAADVVSSVVKATYQTYVEAIKHTDEWTDDAKAHALQMATDAAKSKLSEEIKTYISENFGDVDLWLKDQIEAKLYDLKNAA